MFKCRFRTWNDKNIVAVALPVVFVIDVRMTNREYRAMAEIFLETRSSLGKQSFNGSGHWRIWYGIKAIVATRNAQFSSQLRKTADLLKQQNVSFIGTICSQFQGKTTNSAGKIFRDSQIDKLTVSELKSSTNSALVANYFCVNIFRSPIFSVECVDKVSKQECDKADAGF